jgi:hypothetical protein
MEQILFGGFCGYFRMLTCQESCCHLKRLVPLYELHLRGYKGQVSDKEQMTWQNKARLACLSVQINVQHST